MRGIFFSLILYFSLPVFAQSIIKLNSGTNTSLRGLSVVSNTVAWASGSNGWVALTLDAGKTWHWQQVKGYQTLDFRDIEAFSASSAIIVNAGSPAVILKTIDGGKTWKETYRNTSPDIFIDAIDFSDSKTGLAFGDPISHRLQLLKTTDGGSTWQDISANLAENIIDGEAGFAASGTTIQLHNKKAWIATGGERSRIFFSPNLGATWQTFPCPVIQGTSSTGIFSINFRNAQNGVAVGGDYKADTLRQKNMLLTTTGGKSWQYPAIAPFGYRSGVCYISRKRVVATGTSGTDISYDGGKTWKIFSPEGFNSVEKSKQGSLIICAGNSGRIYRIYK